MTVLGKSARGRFWSRDGVFAVVGSFESPSKLSAMLLEQCRKDGTGAVPVNGEMSHAFDCPTVADPSEISSLSGIVCVRRDPFATEAVRSAARLGVPVWLSQGTVSDEALGAAEEHGADLIAGGCPLMYLDGIGFPHSIHRFFAKVTRTY